MKDKFYIEELILKYRQGNISKEEIDILLDFFKSREIPDEVAELLQHGWENSGNYIDGKVTRENLDEIIHRTSLNLHVDLQNINGRSPSINRKILKGYLKYAAVILITIGITYFFTAKKTDLQGEKVQYCTIQVAYGSKSKIELPDGTKVVLNSGSYIRYPSVFSNNERLVYFEGEAYFDVTKDSIRPFVVSTPDIRVKVLGTTFNLKAYPEEKSVTTTLLTGRVEIYSTKEMDSDEDPIVLLPNQKVVFNKDLEKPTEKKTSDISTTAETTVQKPDVENITKPDLYTSWKDNVLVFSNEKFDGLIVKMERWYDVKITYDSLYFSEVRFSGKFHKETIEQALEAINLTTPFKYKIFRNEITIYK